MLKEHDFLTVISIFVFIETKTVIHMQRSITPTPKKLKKLIKVITAGNSLANHFIINNLTSNGLLLRKVLRPSIYLTNGLNEEKKKKLKNKFT